MIIWEVLWEVLREDIGEPFILGFFGSTAALSVLLVIMVSLSKRSNLDVKRFSKVVLACSLLAGAYTVLRSSRFFFCPSCGLCGATFPSTLFVLIGIVYKLKYGRTLSIATFIPKVRSFLGI